MFYYIFTLGGPVCLVWGTVLVTIGQLFVMSSLAEYCSIWPTAGGQQFYTQIVAPEGARRFLSYLVGWCVLVGEISTSSSCALNSAQIVAALVKIIHPEVAWKVCGIARFPHLHFLTCVALYDFPHLYRLPRGASPLQSDAEVSSSLAGLRRLLQYFQWIDLGNCLLGDGREE